MQARLIYHRTRDVLGLVSRNALPILSKAIKLANFPGGNDSLKNFMSTINITYGQNYPLQGTPLPWHYQLVYHLTRPYQQEVVYSSLFLDLVSSLQSCFPSSQIVPSVALRVLAISLTIFLLAHPQACLCSWVVIQDHSHLDRRSRDQCQIFRPNTHKHSLQK